MGKTQLQGLQQKNQIKINTLRNFFKKSVQNFEWAVKNGLKDIYYLFFGNDLTKTNETKKDAQGVS